MNRKYLLRGIGIGILIGAATMYGAYTTTGKNASGSDNTKIVAEATTEKEVEKTTEATTEKTTEKTTEATTEKTTEKTTEATTEKTTEKTTEATTEKTTEKTTEATTEKTTEKTTEATTEATTEKKEETTEKKEETTEKKEDTTEKKEEAKTSDGDKEITVSSGMGSEEIAALLEEAGLVDSATKFNEWLVENDYDSKLHVGTFKIKAGSKYEDIVKILMTEGQ